MKRALVIAALWAAACGPPASKKSKPPTGIIVVACDVADAEVWIDGQYVTSVQQAKGGVRVLPGLHRLEVRHDRYHSHYAELTIDANEREEHAVELAERLL